MTQCVSMPDADKQRHTSTRFQVQFPRQVCVWPCICSCVWFLVGVVWLHWKGFGWIWHHTYPVWMCRRMVSVCTCVCSPFNTVCPMWDCWTLIRFFFFYIKVWRPNGHFSPLSQQCREQLRWYCIYCNFPDNLRTERLQIEETAQKTHLSSEQNKKNCHNTNQVI